MDIAAYVADLEKTLEVNFKNKQLLLQALTQMSYFNENRHERHIGYNERLEFLGDAVLSLVVAEYLYRSLPPSTQEGKLSSIRSELVNNTTLGEVAKALKIPYFLRLGIGQSQEGREGRAATRLAGNALEAIIGAIYIDRGKVVAEMFILDTIIPRLRDVLRHGTTDWKTKLQQLVQSREMVTPHYELLSTDGPDPERRVVVQVLAGDRMLATGSGPNRKLAEKAAAIRALSMYDE